MPFQIIHGDITKLKVDVIVNSANPKPIIGGGVDFNIHKAAGYRLIIERTKHGDIQTGEAIMTPGFHLPASYVIHTVGPVWQGGNQQEESLLRKAYRSSLQLAYDQQLQSIAFPVISGGIYGYPIEQAIQVAINEISLFLIDHDLDVYLVLFNRSLPVISRQVQDEVTQYIGINQKEELMSDDDIFQRQNMEIFTEKAIAPKKRVKYSIPSLEELDIRPSESFSTSLLRLIDERGLKDSEVYKKANIDRKHFSKIRNQDQYQPSKSTVFAFAIALQFTVDETKDLLQKAGYALSSSQTSDIILQYCLEKNINDIHQVNAILYSFNQGLLGNSR